MELYCCRLGSVVVELHCYESQQVAKIIAFWQQTYPCFSASEPPAATIVISFLKQNSTTSSPQRQQEIFRIEDLKINRIVDGYLFSIDNSWLAVNVQSNRAMGMLAEEFWQTSLNQQREFFRFALFVLLRKHGIYGIHANVLCWNQQGLLAIGSSGRGKTSLSLSLLHSGWQAVADDTVGLYTDKGSICALALRRGFSCTPETIQNFPQLQEIAQHSPRLQRDKRWLNLEELYPGSFKKSCSLSLLLFPTIGTDCHSRLQPLDATTTVSELVLHSPTVMIDPPTVALQMQLFAQLVQQVPAYRIVLGRDVFDQPTLVSELIRSALPVHYALH